MAAILSRGKVLITCSQADHNALISFASLHDDCCQHLATRHRLGDSSSELIETEMGQTCYPIKLGHLQAKVFHLCCLNGEKDADGLV